MMSAFVRKYPALSLLLVAGALGVTPLLLVSTGVLPPGASQLGALSASLAGLALVAVEGRRGGVRELLGRFLIWRVGWQWWAYVLLFPIVPSVAALYLFQALGGPAVDWSELKPLPSVVPMVLLLTIFAGIGEEFGWRGFALPRLQARHNALVSSLIVGACWSAWHIPLFFTTGTSQNEMLIEVGALTAILGYSLFVTVNSIQHTWVFNNTRGSVLVAAFMHGAANAWVGGYIDVYRHNFGGVLVFGALTTLVSLAVVMLAGPAHLSRVTTRDTLPSEAAEVPLNPGSASNLSAPQEAVGSGR